MGLDVGAKSEPVYHCEPQHQTKRDFSFLGSTWADQQGGSQASKEEVLPARRVGKALLSAPLGLRKRRHPKDMEEAIVLWMRGQFGALGAACRHSRYLKMEDVGDSGRHLMGGLGYKTLIGCLSELRKQWEISR